jgi:hypothetical protein
MSISPDLGQSPYELSVGKSHNAIVEKTNFKKGKRFILKSNLTKYYMAKANLRVTISP